MSDFKFITDKIKSALEANVSQKFDLGYTNTENFEPAAVEKDIDQTAMTTHELKAFYELIGVQVPKKLLPREIELFRQLMKDNETLLESNVQLRNERVPSTKRQTQKRNTTIAIVILSVGFISAMAQFALDSDRRTMMLQIQSLDKSKVVIDNKLLIDQNEELTTQLEVAKNKKCFLF